MTARRLSALAPIVLALSFPAASAAAMPNPHVTPRSEFASFNAKERDGYQLSIVVLQPQRRLLVDVSKGSAALQYALRLRGRHFDRIVARLPGAGRIDLRFHERSRTGGKPGRGCRGGGPFARHGVAVGTIRLWGEDGFGAVSASRIPGTIVGQGREVCPGNHHRHERKRRARAQITTLLATESTSRGELTVTAVRVSEKSPRFDYTVLSATLGRSRGGMNITESRSATQEDAGWLAVAGSGATASASLGPPSPFSGAAEFKRGEDGSYAWSGTLSVELPVSGTTALAGPDFSPSLCLDSDCFGDQPRGPGRHAEFGVIFIS